MTASERSPQTTGILNPTSEISSVILISPQEISPSRALPQSGISPSIWSKVTEKSGTRSEKILTFAFETMISPSKFSTGIEVTLRPRPFAGTSLWSNGVSSVF